MKWALAGLVIGDAMVDAYIERYAAMGTSV